MDIDDIVEIAEQNRENIAALAREEGVSGELAHDIDMDGPDKLASVLGGAQPVDKDRSPAERAEHLIEQNAANIVALALAVGIDRDGIATAATADEQDKAFNDFVAALGGNTDTEVSL